MLYDGPHLAGREHLAAGVVAHLLQLLPEWVAAVYPRHEVIYGCAGGAIGKVHQGQLFLGVSTNDKIFHNSFFKNHEFTEFFELILLKKSIPLVSQVSAEGTTIIYNILIF